MRGISSAFCILIIQFLLFACSDTHNTEKQLFDDYYRELQKNNYTGYDSLIHFYQKLDSLQTLYPTNELLYLKTTTEGRLYFRRGDYARSTQKYLAANSFLTTKSETDTLKALNIMSIGLNFMNQAVYDSAFYYFGQALNIFDKAGNRNMVHVSKANMAQAYYNKRDTENALKLINEISADSPGKSVILKINHLKANILGSSGAIDSALILDREMIRNYGNDNDNYLLSSFYNNIALCFLEKGKIDSALYYCNKSYKADSVAGIEIHVAANLVLMGDIYRSTGKNDKADDYYKQALRVFSDDNNIDKKYWIYESLAKWARADGNLQLVIQHQDSMLATYRMMNKLELTRSIELLNIEFATERKNRKIELQNSQLKSQKLLLTLIILTVFFLLIAIWLVAKNREKRAQLRLSEQDRRVSEMLIEAEQNERSRIARDLHDGVNQKLAVLKMHISMLKGVEKDGFNNLETILDGTISDVRDISHNLYPKDLEKGIVAALENLCEQNNYVNKDIRFTLNADVSINLSNLSKNIQLVIYRLVQEITNNALKYSKARNVTIFLAIKNNRIDLKISDDGVGFDTSNNNDSPKGIGLNNIFDRIRQISGKVTVSSEEKKGTSYYIEIPA